MTRDKNVRTERIRQLNDNFRTTLTRGGTVVMTSGVMNLPDDARAQVVLNVAQFSNFTKGDDPYGEHDFGAFNLAGKRFFWKIDYYDKSMDFGADDPSNETNTTRVLTIMLADERILKTKGDQQ